MTAAPLNRPANTARSGTPANTDFADGKEFLFAVREAALIRQSSSVKPIDPRLLAIQHRAASGSSEAVPSDGGFLISPEFNHQIVARMTDVGDIFSRCKQFPTKSNTFIFPQFDESSRAEGSRFGGIKIYLPNEAASLTATKPKFLRSEQPVHKFTGLIYLTSELSVDSDAFATWTPYAFGQELVFKIENLIINGTGADEPLGILNSGALVTVTKQSQGAGTVIAQNVYDMMARRWAASRKTAIWLYNLEIEQQLGQLDREIGTAGSESKLFQWASSADPFNRLGGIPAIPCEYCAAPGSVGDLILADFDRYALVIREIARSEMSIHVEFLTNQNVWRCITRLNGEPIDKSPVTPLNGSSTKSPFIVLAARP